MVRCAEYAPLTDCSKQPQEDINQHSIAASANVREHVATREFSLIRVILAASLASHNMRQFTGQIRNDLRHNIAKVHIEKVEHAIYKTRRLRTHAESAAMHTKDIGKETSTKQPL